MPTETDLLTPEKLRAMADFAKAYGAGDFSATPSATQTSLGFDPEFINGLRTSIITSSVPELLSPTPFDPRKPLVGPARGLEQDARSRQYNYHMRTLDKIQQDAMQLRGLMQANPDIAARLGIDESLFQRVQDRARKVMSPAISGIGSTLGFLLRNLDRPRGALAAAALTYVQGGTDRDALDKGLSVLRGSANGFKLNPNVLGPSASEILIAGGMEENALTTGLGITADVLLDPIALLGVGVSRRMMIGSHQYLNAAGRLKMGELLAAHTQLAVERAGVRESTQLPYQLLLEAERNALTEMRTIVNSGYDSAKQYLDLGGLKFAGTSILPNVITKERQIYLGSRGRVAETYVARHPIIEFSRALGRKSEAWGADLLTDISASRSKQLLGSFLQAAPDWVRQADLNISKILNRTLPQAGEEFKIFKRLHYYDRLGYETQRVRERVFETFKGISSEDRRLMAFAIEENTLDQLISDLTASKGPEYAALVRDAATNYRTILNDMLAEEVRRDFFQQGWSQAHREAFGEWLKDPSRVEAALGEEWTKRFRRVYLDNYVTHYYHNQRLYRARFRPKAITPQGPSIVQPFTHKRDIPTLRAALAAGLIPETDLAKLMAVRLDAGARALVTSDFLEATAREFGHNLSRIEARLRRKGKAAQILPADLREIESISRAMQIDMADLKYEPRWKQAYKLGETSQGRLPMSTAKQIELARDVAHERGVPAEFIAMFDEAARAEFLQERFRRGLNMRALAANWEKYVVRPTQQGLYDGFRVAPGRSLEDAIIKARDIHDPFYTRYVTVTPRGIADPLILGQVELPAPIAGELQRLQKVPIFAPELEDLMRGYVRMTYAWKRFVTVPWPAFHFRNKISNVFNSSLDIGFGATLHRKQMWDVLHGKAGTFVTDDGRKFSFNQLRNIMREHGVLLADYRRNDIVDEIQRLLEQQLTKRGRNIKTAQDALGNIAGSVAGGIANVAPFQAGRDVALAIENGDRALHFMMSLKRGGSIEDALRRTNQFLFDYADISAVEAGISKYAVPFLRWTRKNLPLQVQQIAAKPARYNRVGNVLNNLSKEENTPFKLDVERVLFPQALRSTFNIRVDAAEGWSKYIVGGDLPAEDLNMIYDLSLRDTGRTWVRMGGPVIQTIFEWLSDTDLWSGQKRSSLKSGQRTAEWLMSAPPQIRKFLGVREEMKGGDSVVTIDRGKLKAFMAMLAFTQTRVYSTLVRWSDPNEPLHLKLWHTLTGMRYQYIRPRAQLSRMFGQVLSDDDFGIAPQLEYAKRQALTLLQTDPRIAEMAAEADRVREAERTAEIAETKSLINLPQTPSDLEDLDEPELGSQF